METEIIYILTNEAMPGYCKVGKTDNSIYERMKQLDNTSVPLPFECFYAAKVEKEREVEQHLHDAFDDNRVNSRREFFEIAPERIVSALKMVELENVTPTTNVDVSEEDKVALYEAKEKRARFNFEMVEVPVGAELYFSRDEKIKAKVVEQTGNKTIEYKGELCSLSESAQDALGVDYGVAGTDYWKYKGETLDERRRRMSEED